MRQVVGAADTMHLSDIVTGLAELRPALYGSLDPGALGSQLRTADVRVGQVHVPGNARHKASNKRVKREWLDVSTTRQVGNSDPGEGASC